MVDDKCKYKECEHYRDGNCLDIKSLKDPYRQTGCIYYTGRNNYANKEVLQLYRMQGTT